MVRPPASKRNAAGSPGQQRQHVRGFSSAAVTHELQRITAVGQSMYPAVRVHNGRGNTVFPRQLPKGIPQQV